MADITTPIQSILTGLTFSQEYSSNFLNSQLNIPKVVLTSVDTLTVTTHTSAMIDAVMSGIGIVTQSKVSSQSDIDTNKLIPVIPLGQPLVKEYWL
jgi:DNA-binding transcriptional LysR family regulator